MGHRKNYPENILDALHINREINCCLQFDELTEDQYKGIEYVFSILSEREQIVFRHYFVEGMTRKAIAEKYSVTEYRIKQIIDRALRKYRMNKEWLYYIANGYEGNSEYLSSQLEKEEMAYRERFGITDKTHLYYQDFNVFEFPARIHNPLNKKGIKTVRDLIVFVCSSDRVRNFGDLSAKTVCDALKEKNLLPQNWEIQSKGYSNLPRLNVELKVFKELNECQ